jgi:uncharacterized protein YjdB
MTLSTTIEKLHSCKRALTNWSSQKFGDVPKRLKSMTKRLDLLQRNEYPGNLEAITHLQKEVDHLLEVEDIKWQQRAQWTWFKKGDRNTRFFRA